MKMPHLILMFLAVFSGGMAVSKAWDIISGSITGELGTHILILIVFLAAAVYFFMRYVKSRNLQQRDER